MTYMYDNSYTYMRAGEQAQQIKDLISPSLMT